LRARLFEHVRQLPEQHFEVLFGLQQRLCHRIPRLWQQSAQYMTENHSQASLHASKLNHNRAQ
jgi:hypothetical protein